MVHMPAYILLVRAAFQQSPTLSAQKHSEAAERTLRPNLTQLRR
jgi:hypothetical protein